MTHNYSTYDYRYKSINALKMIGDILFFFALFVFTFDSFFEATKWVETYKIGRYIADSLDFFYNRILEIVLLICILSKIIIGKNKMIYIFLTVLFGGLAYCSSFFTNDKYVYIMFLLILAAKGANAKKILIFMLSITLPLLSITVISSLNGLIDNYIEIYRHREFLGFSWTTTPVMIFCYGLFMILILKCGEMSTIEFFGFHFVNLWLFLKTNTRFAFCIVFVTLFLSMFFKKAIYHILNIKIIKIFAIVSPWIFAGLAIGTAYFYNENSFLLRKINNILSKRLSYCNKALKVYKINLFGQNINFGHTDYYVDTAYLQSLFRFGLLIFLVLLYVSSALLYKLYKNKLYMGVFVFLIILFFGLTEQQLFWLQYDSVLLLLFSDMNGLIRRKNASFKYKLKT